VATRTGPFHSYSIFYLTF